MDAFMLEINPFDLLDVPPSGPGTFDAVDAQDEADAHGP